MQRGYGEYPEGWPEFARKLKEEADWKCIRCQHPHEPKAGYTLTVLCRLLFSAILNVGARLALSPLVLVASVTQSLAEWLDQTPAVFARLGRLFDLPIAMGQKLFHAPVHDHVAATAKNRDVFRCIVAGIGILVMALGRTLSATLALAEGIKSLRPGPLGFRASSISLPIGMRRAAQSGKLAAIFSVGSRLTSSALVAVAANAEATA